MSTPKRLVQSLVGSLGYEINRRHDVWLDMKKIVQREDAVILDIGACTGDTAGICRKTFPKAKIHSFEPDPRVLPQLRANLRGDSRTEVHDFALSDKEGKATFFMTSAPATSSLLPTDEKLISYWKQAEVYDAKGEVEVKTTTVDAFCERHGISTIDILKMDVQGGEFLVLAGAERLIAEKRIACIFFEVIVVPTYVGQRKLHEYLKALDDLGYEFHDFYYPARHDGRLTYMDVLFVAGESPARAVAAVGEPAASGV